MVSPAPGGELHGLVLAAGAGRRMGRPKATVLDADGVPWIARAVRVLRDGGCEQVNVVLGAGAEEARGLLPDDASVVVADDWAAGLSASLRAGLRALDDTPADAAMIHLVDLPDVGADVVARVAATGVHPAALARAEFFSRPGHPVLMGRDHWSACAAAISGDRGAGAYLERRRVTAVACDDLASGRDQDGPLEGS
jgi:molybdenum cofactor cytidylyltransferase/nicotine blue oxidoreductase